MLIHPEALAEFKRQVFGWAVFDSRHQPEFTGEQDLSAGSAMASPSAGLHERQYSFVRTVLGVPDWEALESLDPAVALTRWFAVQRPTAEAGRTSGGHRRTGPNPSLHAEAGPCMFSPLRGLLDNGAVHQLLRRPRAGELRR